MRRGTWNDLAVAEFTRAYPGIEVEIWIEDGLVDIVASGFDAGIRNAHLLQPDMISVRIDDGVDFAYVASPTYLAEGRTVLSGPRPAPAARSTASSPRCA